MITFQEIGPDNWQTDLSVSAEQQKYVDSASQIIAELQENDENQYYGYFILNDSVPVGMVYYSDFPVLNAYNLCQFFIDSRYQRKGYGKQAITQLLSMMAKDRKYPQVYVSYIRGNETARKLYESLGFVHTGYEYEDTIDMKRALPPAE